MTRLLIINLLLANGLLALLEKGGASLLSDEELEAMMETMNFVAQEPK